MKICPHCGNEIFYLDINCPYCKKPLKNYFTIPIFLLENFRLFTIIGVIGTMLALMPNLGTQILGPAWITNHDSIFPLYLSVAMFFGTLFIVVLFLSVFSLILQSRDNEQILTKITILNKVFTLYEGDYQRLILIICLSPMAIGLVAFLISLMVYIQNVYSFFFAIFILLILFPTIVYLVLGWNLGKSLTLATSDMGEYKTISGILLVIIAFEVMILVMHAFPLTYGDEHIFSNNIKIETDQEYFSPQISSEKGLRLEITNLSGRETLISTHSWSANYGYFIWVSPSTPEVRILGNPVYNSSLTQIYWTYPVRDIGSIKPPVKIELQLNKITGNVEIAHPSLNLTWYDTDIAYVNTSPNG
ncbi:MAG: zinc ribbon domain-containing protein [Methanoregula sp.]